jgi:hypothetical protein
MIRGGFSSSLEELDYRGRRRVTSSWKIWVNSLRYSTAYARDSIDFRWYGSDEGDQVEREGSAELLDDGTMEIEFSYDNGDEAVLKAKRETSSTAG